MEHARSRFFFNFCVSKTFFQLLRQVSVGPDPRAQKPPALETTWACALCGEENPGAPGQCIACGEINTAFPAPVVPASPSKHWECGTCGEMNKAARSVKRCIIDNIQRKKVSYIAHH